MCNAPHCAYSVREPSSTPGWALGDWCCNSCIASLHVAQEHVAFEVPAFEVSYEQRAACPTIQARTLHESQHHCSVHNFAHEPQDSRIPSTACTASEECDPHTLHHLNAVQGTHRCRGRRLERPACDMVDGTLERLQHQGVLWHFWRVVHGRGCCREGVSEGLCSHPQIYKTMLLRDVSSIYSRRSDQLCPAVGDRASFRDRLFLISVLAVHVEACTPLPGLLLWRLLLDGRGQSQTWGSPRPALVCILVAVEACVVQGLSLRAM